MSGPAIIAAMANKFPTGPMLPQLGTAISDTGQLLEYLVEAARGRVDEFVHAFFVDQSGRLAWSEVLASGRTGLVSVSYRDLIRIALRIDATGIILAHNHPSGMAAPSPRDVTTTLDLERVCGKLGIQLIDHLIVAGETCFSFKAERILRRSA